MIHNKIYECSLSYVLGKSQYIIRHCFVVVMCLVCANCSRPVKLACLRRLDDIEFI